MDFKGLALHTQALSRAARLKLPGEGVSLCRVGA